MVSGKVVIKNRRVAFKTGGTFLQDSNAVQE